MEWVMGQQSNHGGFHAGCLDVVEKIILPPRFGAQLEQVAFLRPTDRNKIADPNEKEDEYARTARLEAFFDGITNCSGIRGGGAALGTMFEICVKGSHPVSSKDLVDSSGSEVKANVIDVLDLAYCLALATELLRNGEMEEDIEMLVSEADQGRNQALQSMASSCLNFVSRQRIQRSVAINTIDDSDLDQGFCSKMDFLEWSKSTAPSLSLILPSFLYTIFFPEKPCPPCLSPFTFPQLNDESAILGNGNSALLFSFACMSKSLGGAVRFFGSFVFVCQGRPSHTTKHSFQQWHRLYTSSDDGLSFNRLQNALLGYGGPTLIVIRSTDGCVFGAFTASKWKESKDYFGNSDCFLYQLTPQTRFLQPTGNEANYMYCNSQARLQGYNQLPRGIGFGGCTTRGPRLFIDESFSGCYASSRDKTFQTGDLLPCTDSFSQKIYFSIHQLEVWGCGGEDVVAEALESRRQARSLRAAQIRNYRTVDKAAFLTDLRSGLIESKAFGHMDEIHGSTRVRVLNRNKNRYAYEK